MTRFDIADAGQFETPSPNLDPENFITYETGLKLEYKLGAAQLAYYYTDINDLIVRTPTGATVDGLAEVTKKNAGEGFIHGVEISGSLRLHPQWTSKGAFTWMEGELETFPTSAPVKETEPVSRLMPTTVNLSLQWDHPSRRHWVEGLCTLASAQDRLSTADKNDTERIPPGGTPGYAVFSLRGGWRPGENLTVSLAIENLTDEDYRIHGSGLNEPGRNVVVSIDLVF